MKKPDSNFEFEGLSPEQKAFIYQQINEFTPFFMPDSDVEVTVQKEEIERDTVFSVVFILSGGGSFIQSEGKASSIYDAVKEAKNQMLTHLHAIQQKVVSSDDREKELEEIKKNSTIH